MHRIPSLRLAAVALVAAGLLLTGCGVKGPLDPPPSASATSQPTPQPTAQPQQPTSRRAGRNDKPVAAPGQKRSLPMDVLLN